MRAIHRGCYLFHLLCGRLIPRWGGIGHAQVGTEHVNDGLAVVGVVLGEVLKPMGQVGPGETSFDLQGLNAQLDYCFAIVAVYSTSRFASSPQTCTSRAPSTLPKQRK